MNTPAKTRVMFVCIGNACRSPMAEAIARQDANDVMEVSSAGLFPLGFLPDMTLQTLTRNGYSTEALESKPIRHESLLETDLVINLSGYTQPHALAAARQVEHWEVEDPYGEDAAIYQTILEDIERRVKHLTARLRKAESGKA
jgi:arsenate reductase (thioredoxin)